MGKRFECIIFDCDGTLVDSEPLTHQALATLVQEAGVSVTPEEMLAQFKGWKLTAIFAGVEEKYGVTLMEKPFRELQWHLLKTHLQPIDGVHAMLEQITLPMCVASSSPPEKLDLTLGITELRSFFDPHIFSSYTIQKWKPEPDLFLHAAAVMGYAPEACAVIEDSDVGVEAALAAGMQPFWYNPKQLSYPDDTVVHFQQMGELPTLLHEPLNQHRKFSTVYRTTHIT